jgi:hypothetical protein
LQFQPIKELNVLLQAGSTHKLQAMEATQIQVTGIYIEKGFSDIREYRTLTYQKNTAH